MKQILLWIRICRPQTWLAAIIAVLIGVFCVNLHTPVSWGVAFMTVVCAVTIQILSNVINDYFDFIRGIDKAGRAGFKRALAEGEVGISAMRKACIIAAVLALLQGVFFCYIGGWVILIIGLSALFFAWLYSATPYSLSYLGVGEIFIFLYDGVIASCGSAYIQYKYLSLQMPEADAFVATFYSGGWDSVLMQTFFAGGVAGLLSMSALLINNIRDIDDDRAGGKMTFPVRFGKKVAYLSMLLIFAFIPIFAYIAFGWSWSMLTGVPALLLWLMVVKAKGTEYNKCFILAEVVNLIYLVICFAE